MEELIMTGHRETVRTENRGIADRTLDRKPDIVMISTTDWDRLRQRPEQIAIRLAKDRKVLYVEPFGKVPLSKRFSALRTMENISIYTPPDLTKIPLLGKAFSLLLGRLNVSLLISDLRYLREKIGLRGPVLLILNPYSHRLARTFRGSPIVYDCVDDWPAFSRHPEQVWKKERRLIGKCDAVLVTAHRILDRRKGYARRIYVVPNAADFDHFNKALGNEVSNATELSGLGRPIIGYIGALYRWVDFDLIIYLARRNPSWNIALIGPSHPHLLARLQEPNIHVLGKKQYQRLPSYLKRIDVCIIPFQVNDITLGVDPVKVYEYLAAGKPIVSTSLPELKKFQDAVRQAKDYGDFESKVKEAIVEDDHLITKRVSIAKENTWNDRATQISQIIEELISEKSQGAG